MLSANFVNIFQKFLETKKIYSKIIFLFLLLAVIMLPLYNKNLRNSFYPFTEKYFVDYYQDQIAVSSYIEDNTSPREKVLIIGAETSILALSQRESATKYVYQYPLDNKEYSTLEKIDDFLNEIIVNKPTLILISPITQFNEDGLFFQKLNSYSRIWSNCEEISPIGNWKIFECNW